MRLKSADLADPPTTPYPVEILYKSIRTVKTHTKSPKWSENTPIFPALRAANVTSNIKLSIKVSLYESISRRGNHRTFNKLLGNLWWSFSIVRILQDLVEMERGLGTHGLAKLWLRHRTLIHIIIIWRCIPSTHRILSHGIRTGPGKAWKKSWRITPKIDKMHGKTRSRWPPTISGSTNGFTWKS